MANEYKTPVYTDKSTLGIQVGHCHVQAIDILIIVAESGKTVKSQVTDIVLG